MRGTIDWEWVRAEFEAHQLTNVAIAALHLDKFGVKLSESAIRKRAGIENWRRKSGELVRQRTAEKLIGAKGRGAAGDGNRSGADVIEEAAERAVLVVREHQAEIRALRATANTLRLSIDAELGKDVSKGAGLYRTTYLSRAAASLGTLYRTLIPLERQSLNLDMESNKPIPYDPEHAVDEEMILMVADEIRASRVADE